MRYYILAFLLLTLIFSGCNANRNNQALTSIKIPTKLDPFHDSSLINEVTKKNFNLLFFVWDGECVGCIAELDLWDEKLQAASFLESKLLSINYILRET